MLIDGKAIAQSIYEDIATRVSRLPFKPIFCDVLIGEDPASVQYVHMKARKAEQLGFQFLQASFPSSVAEAEVVARIHAVCRMAETSGVIVQLPVPEGFSKDALVNAISLEVDVDCLTHQNIALLYENRLPFVPPTPAAILAVLDTISTIHSLQGVRCVVVGQGELVGKPIAHLLTVRGAEVNVITRDTVHPEHIAAQADVLITGVGRPGLVTAEWVKEGAIVIDAGTAESGGSVMGDVHAASVQAKAAFLSPTPGGVGPITVAKLFWNVLQVAEAKRLKRD